MKPALILSALLALPASIAFAQDAGGSYVNIGEYTGDLTAPATAPAMMAPLQSYETAPAPVAAPLYEFAPDQITVMPEAYAAPVVYSEPVVYSAPVIATAPLATMPYQAPPAIATGFADREYEAARLAAYDTNRDGTVTTGEAVATMRPLGGQ